MKLHIDIETFSSIDLKKSGSYKYMESIDFEILLVAYAIDDQDIKVIDLTADQQLPSEFLEALQDPKVLKCAHNANFERNAFRTYGYDIPVEQWECTSVKAAYCGLPLSLAGVSEALELGDKSKDAAGKALIKYFCLPCKATKVNGGRTRNFPHHDPVRWSLFMDYCGQDVQAERAVDMTLSIHEMPQSVKDVWYLDQEINDRGIEIDLDLAKSALAMNEEYATIVNNQLKTLTGLDNPNSAAQLKGWLSEAMGKEIKSLAKDTIPTLIAEAESSIVRDVLSLRAKASRTSIKKYVRMLDCVCEDGRVRGLFQYYGANRTGRWAGRLVQLQNLPQNHLDDLDLARELVKKGDFESLEIVYDDISSLLSQLIRTAFVAKKGKTFAVADFSAIEARVIAWLAQEQWRLDVFNSHGKIYEASAAMMFKVPIEEVTKTSDYRAKGKVAELALGYQGAGGALAQMGGERMGLTEHDMATIVRVWREANPSIKNLWSTVEACVIRAMKTRKEVVGTPQNLKFNYENKVLTIELPSGRKLYYQKPNFTINKWGKTSVKYRGTDQTTGKWSWVDSYGGKFVENIVQAIARDILAVSMLRLKAKGYEIVMHVHDETVNSVDEQGAEQELEKVCDIMGADITWAKGLPLGADGYVTPFYKKD